MKVDRRKGEGAPLAVKLRNACRLTFFLNYFFPSRLSCRLTGGFFGDGLEVCAAETVLFINAIWGVGRENPAISLFAFARCLVGKREPTRIVTIFQVGEWESHCATNRFFDFSELLRASFFKAVRFCEPRACGSPRYRLPE